MNKIIFKISLAIILGIIMGFPIMAESSGATNPLDLVLKIKGVELGNYQIVNYGDTINVDCLGNKELPDDSTLELLIHNVDTEILTKSSPYDFFVKDSILFTPITFECKLTVNDDEVFLASHKIKIPDVDGDFRPDRVDKCKLGDDRIDLDGDGVPNKCDSDEKQTIAATFPNAIPVFNRDTNIVTISYNYKPVSDICHVKVDNKNYFLNLANNSIKSGTIIKIPCKGKIFLDFNSEVKAQKSVTAYVPFYQTVNEIVVTDNSLVIDEVVILYTPSGIFNPDNSLAFSYASKGIDLWIYPQTTHQINTDDYSITKVYQFVKPPEEKPNTQKSGSGVIHKNKCKPDGFGSGISLRLYEISYDKNNQTLDVLAYSTCGPISVKIATPYGLQMSAMSADQPYIDEKKLKFTGKISDDLKSVNVIIKDKRDSFTEKIRLINSNGTIVYSHFTGYTSEQQETIIPQSKTPTIPSKTSFLIKEAGKIHHDPKLFEEIDILIEIKVLDYSRHQMAESLKGKQIIPEWTYEIINLWGESEISEEEFISAFQYLLDKRIIRIQ